MSKIKLSGKLSLNKERISKLNDDQMDGVKGGLFNSRLFCSRNCIATRDSSCDDMSRTQCACEVVAPGPGGDGPSPAAPGPNRVGA